MTLNKKPALTSVFINAVLLDLSVKRNCGSMDKVIEVYRWCKGCKVRVQAVHGWRRVHNWCKQAAVREWTTCYRDPCSDAWWQEWDFFEMLYENPGNSYIGYRVNENEVKTERWILHFKNDLSFLWPDGKYYLDEKNTFHPVKKSKFNTQKDSVTKCDQGLYFHGKRSRKKLKIPAFRRRDVARSVNVFLVGCSNKRGTVHTSRSSVNKNCQCFIRDGKCSSGDHRTTLPTFCTARV